MIDLLADMNWETVMGGIFLLGAGIGTGLGGGKAIQRRAQRRNNNDCRTVCAVHEEFASKLDERHETIKTTLTEIKGDIQGVLTELRRMNGES